MCLTINQMNTSSIHLGSLIFPQVIKWIDEHGEPFLTKHTDVGITAEKTEALLKRHEEFETIAQVRTHTVHHFDLYFNTTYAVQNVYRKENALFNMARITFSSRCFVLSCLVLSL